MIVDGPWTPTAWYPSPVLNGLEGIVTTRDNKDYVRVLFYSHYTTITGWGVLLMYMSDYQNHGPLLGPLNTRCRITPGCKKGP